MMLSLIVRDAPPENPASLPMAPPLKKPRPRAELSVRIQLFTVTFEWSLYMPPPLTKPKWLNPLVIVKP